MQSKQPIWKLVANLGDVNPLDYGGFLVWVDTTGVYPPEAEVIELDAPDDDDSPLTTYRFILEPCTFIGGVLSDNPFHPDCAVWFADRLESIANCQGIGSESLLAWFLSTDPIDRGNAWRAVGEYFGWQELDSYPCQYTRAEMADRLRKLANPEERKAARVSLPSKTQWRSCEPKFDC